MTHASFTNHIIQKRDTGTIH